MKESKEGVGGGGREREATKEIIPMEDVVGVKKRKGKGGVARHADALHQGEILACLGLVLHNAKLVNIKERQ